MIMDIDDKITKELDPNSWLDESKLKLLGWIPTTKISGSRNSYNYHGNKEVTLIESWKGGDEWSVPIRNGYSFHMRSWVSHCWTVEDLLELMERCKVC